MSLIVRLSRHSTSCPSLHACVRSCASPASTSRCSGLCSACVALVFIFVLRVPVCSPCSQFSLSVQIFALSSALWVQPTEIFFFSAGRRDTSQSVHAETSRLFVLMSAPALCPPVNHMVSPFSAGLLETFLPLLLFLLLVFLFKPSIPNSLPALTEPGVIDLLV